MIGNVIETHLPVMGIGKCRNCEWWSKALRTYTIKGAFIGGDKTIIVRPCTYMYAPSDIIELTAEDHSCIHWEGEQRTGDEVV